jgi:hypothetical protein
MFSRLENDKDVKKTIAATTVARSGTSAHGIFQQSNIFVNTAEHGFILLEQQCNHL